jgi:hypothetical protein
MGSFVSDEHPEVTLLIRHWGNGGSALPAVKKLLECGDSDHAAAIALLALRAPDCADREELEAAIAQAANVSEAHQLIPALFGRMTRELFDRVHPRASRFSD